MITPKLSFLLLVGLGCCQVGNASGQCLSLRQLISIGTDPAARANPEKFTQLPSTDWAFQGTVPRSTDIYWNATAVGGSKPPATLLLRSQQQSVDVVLKTTDAACLRQVRGELKELQLAPVPVTCPGCEAQRYDGSQFQTTLYSNMKGDYPYVLVVHPRTATVVPAATGGKSNQSTTAQ